MLELLGRDDRRDGPRLCWPLGGHNIQKTKASELAEALERWVLAEFGGQTTRTDD